MFSIQRYLGVLLAGFVMLWLAGCRSGAQTEEIPAAVQVSVMPLQTRALLVTEDLSGRVVAVRSAEIRSQISGIVQHRLFEQGAEIQAGTVLFQINPAPFKADVEVAAAALLRAEAVFERARLETERLVSLTQSGVISRQALDDAVSLRAQAAADVAQAKASLARRKLDLQFASVEAPIAGRIDQALVSEGALVSPTDSTPMARIQQIDQVYVDVRLPASMLESMHYHADSEQPQLMVEILNSDGKPLGIAGYMLFSGIEVDAGTGDVLLRVLVDNPKHRLLPGLYVKTRIPLAYYTDALSIPQQAISRLAGQTRVWVLDEQNQVQSVAIEIGELVEGQYRVISGLRAGQKVVIEGIERLTPGAQVAARPWQIVAASDQSRAVTRPK